MARPTKHQKTHVYWFRQRVPRAIGPRAAGQIVSVKVADKLHTVRIGAELKVSLGTKDRGEAFERAREAQDEYDLIWASFAQAPTRLPSRLCVALSGQIYRFFKDTFEDDPEAAKGWAAVHRRRTEDAKRYNASPQKALMIVSKRGSPADALHLAADHYLAEHHLNVDTDSYQRLMVELDRAYGDVAALLERYAHGDYSPDTVEQRFPPIDVPAPPGPATSKPSPKAALGLIALLEHKHKYQSMKQDTFTKYRGRLQHFIKFTGQDTALAITKDHVRDWRDSLIAQGLARKTINDQYLAALKATLNHGVKEFNLAVNVADKIRDERAAPAPTGSKAYGMEQAQAILTATFKGTTKDIAAPYQRAIFWAPWICAYTGLRISEITQFQGRHLRESDGSHFMLITPEDGSTKNGNAWTIGVHRHLIELGLLQMFRAIGDGPAFYQPYPDGTDLAALVNHRSKESADKVGEWVTEALGTTAPGGRPSHAWRHTFTTLSRSVGMDTEARNYMMGSRSTTDAREGYGDWPPEVVAAQINKLPRIEVEETSWRPTLAKVPPASPRAPAVPKSTAQRKRKGHA